MPEPDCPLHQQSSRFWQAIARLPYGAGLIADWRIAAGPSWPWVSFFLRPTLERSGSFPCLADPPCECRHEVIDSGDIELCVCACADGECPAAVISPADRVVFELDHDLLGASLGSAFGIRPLHGSGSAPETARFWHIGEWTTFFAPVFFALRVNAQTWSECFQAAAERPFLLLATQLAPGFRAPVGNGLVLSLESILDVASPGVFRLREAIQPGLASWLDRSSRGSGFSQILRGIHQEIAEVRSEYAALKSARDHLQQMQAEGLLEFLSRVDSTSFKQLAAILSAGDVAKASRTLGIKDATLRSALAAWKTRGPAYQGMLELVRWRKKSAGRAKIPFNENILHERAASVDFPGLLADVLEGLISMNEANWEGRVEELKELLRSADV